MPILNFKEISKANGVEAPDTFELFARDFLSYLGYRILENPSRGADGGKDLVVQETRKGVSGETKINWLVSCKHYAHSDKSVTPSDEQSISDRIQQHKCDGFIGFYSTLASSALMDRLNCMSYQFQILDSAFIENKLIGSLEGELLAKRYFINSMADFLNTVSRPVKLFKEIPQLYCEYCNKELLNSEKIKNSIIVFYYEYNRKNSTRTYKKVSTCC